mgnify:CR=1 FL=1
MGSILTNNSAMVALETLRGINKGLQQVQQQVSTGKQIANAKDNAAFWAISSVMQSDVSAFKGISETLSLGQATLAVARSGAETVTDLLNEMKGRIVAAQEQNVDRSKIQADVAELINQVVATVEASQFNGLNMLQDEVGNEIVSVLGSLNRSTAGVTVSTIDVARTPLTSGRTNSDQNIAVAANANVLTIDTADTVNQRIEVGTKIAISITNPNDRSTVFAVYEVTQADLADAVVATNNAAVATGIRAAINAQITALGFPDVTVGGAGAVINVANTGVAPDPALRVRTQIGGLAGVDMIDVSNKTNAAESLRVIEDMVQLAIDSAAAMGSSGKRMEIQAEFIVKLSDALKSGIGAIVDADMEAASARLQALQVQQQLGTQALSIANQQPQSILSLFQ